MSGIKYTSFRKMGNYFRAWFWLLWFFNVVIILTLIGMINIISSLPLVKNPGFLNKIRKPFSIVENVLKHAFLCMDDILVHRLK